MLWQQQFLCHGHHYSCTKAILVAEQQFRCSHIVCRFAEILATSKNWIGFQWFSLPRSSAILANLADHFDEEKEDVRKHTNLSSAIPAHHFNEDEEEEDVRKRTDLSVTRTISISRRPFWPVGMRRHWYTCTPGIPSNLHHMPAKPYNRQKLELSPQGGKERRNREVE
jgi:hypothetical protein